MIEHACEKHRVSERTNLVEVVPDRIGMAHDDSRQTDGSHDADSGCHHIMEALSARLYGDEGPIARNRCPRQKYTSRAVYHQQQTNGRKYTADEIFFVKITLSRELHCWELNELLGD